MKAIRWTKIFRVVLFTCIWVTLSSCTVENKPAPTNAEIAQATSKNAASLTPSQTMSRTATFPPLTPTPSSTPTVVTATNTPVPYTPLYPTWTPKSATFTPHPIASLDASGAKKMIDLLLPGTPDCQLPCWNGVTPGVSGINQLQGFFARLGIDKGFLVSEKIDTGKFTMTAEFGNYPDKHKGKFAPKITIYWENNIVKAILIRSINYSTFNFAELSANLGFPDQIHYEVGNGGGYTIRLHYKKQRVIALVHGKSIRGKLVCLPGPEGASIEMFTYAPDWESYMLDLRGGYWRQWEVTLNLSTQEVFEKLQQPDACLPDQ